MNWSRRDLLIATGLAIVVRGAAAAPGPARRLKLYNAHTKETFDGPYRDADGPLADAMADLERGAYMLAAIKLRGCLARLFVATSSN